MSSMTLSQQIAASRGKKAGEPKTQAGKLLKHLIDMEARNGGSLASADDSRAFISLESLDDHGLQSLGTTLDNLESMVKGIATESHVDAFPVPKDSDGRELRDQQYLRTNAMLAGMHAALIGQAKGEFVKTPAVRKPALESNEAWIDYSGQGDYTAERLKVALESYDEKDNRHATAYSVAYNMLAARQDAFGEAFFPTVIVSPDQTGYVVTVRLINVMNDLRRQTSGDLDNFNKRNIIHGVIDASILSYPQTDITPVVRDESEKFFVDTTLLPPRDVIVAGETVTTSALAFAKKFSLLGISQTDALLETGKLDVTDSIDTKITLKNVYLQTGAAGSEKIIRISTDILQYSNFNYAVQGHYRQMVLNFATTAVGLTGEIKDAQGNVITAMAPIADNHVKLAFSVNGTVNLETADTQLTASEVSVDSVYDKDGVQLPLDSGVGQTIAALFEGAKLVGYDLEARRTNVNRRQRGQLLTTDFYSQLYPVPLHAPITILRPVTISDQTDASDLSALITATHIMTSNAAVTKLQEFAAQLPNYYQADQVVRQAPEILGAANFLVKAFYEHDTIDMVAQIDSHKSFERMADVQALLVNVIRDGVYRAWRDSGYKAAADALAGGVAPKPTVIIGTDPVIANYIMVTGDLRTLGNDFNVKVVQTLDSRVKGKIYVSFGQFGDGNEGQPNPMHFGNMGWKPEITLVLPMTRNGQISKELTVQPSFVHVVNLPILLEYDVIGIEEVVDHKVAMNINDVTAP